MMRCVLTYPRNRCRFLLALACATVAPNLGATTIGITNTQPLSFGTFVAGTGSVTVSPNGTRIASGGVIVLATGPGQAAQFVVAGDANVTYAVTLPPDSTVSIANGGNNMPVNGFVSSPASTGVLSGGGIQTLNVGARLDVVDGRPVGDYSGSFIVVVDYN